MFICFYLISFRCLSRCLLSKANGLLKGAVGREVPGAGRAGGPGGRGEHRVEPAGPPIPALAGGRRLRRGLHHGGGAQRGHHRGRVLAAQELLFYVSKGLFGRCFGGFRGFLSRFSGSEGAFGTSFGPKIAGFLSSKGARGSHFAGRRTAGS